MQQAFQEHIDTHFPELRTKPFLIAVSGGLDSIVLTHLCRKLGLRFGIAHVNFRLRGEDSDSDARFVADLAARWKVPYYTASFDTMTIKSTKKGSTQEIARDLRYGWFEKLVLSEDFDYVVTAHHADDDLETFLLNLLRGTGLKGLSGIPKRRDFLIRPLLEFSRSDILEFAKEHDLQWSEDASNESDIYRRNAVRHHIIPELSRLQPQFIASFRRTRRHLKSATNILDKHIQNIKNQRFIPLRKKIQIHLDSLEEFGSWEDLSYLLLEEYGFTDWEGIRALDKASSGTLIRSETHELLKDRGKLILRPRKETKGSSKNTGSEEGIRLQIEVVKIMEGVGSNALYIDKESLKHRLNVRKWKKGDYFYPLGMGGQKKKLSKFFKDIKLDVFTKEDQWVLCDGDDIIWVIGHRADERYKVQPETQSILRITWTD